jgi:hypothetical protein
MARPIGSLAHGVPCCLAHGACATIARDTLRCTPRRRAGTACVWRPLTVQSQRDRTSDTLSVAARNPTAPQIRTRLVSSDLQQPLTRVGARAQSPPQRSCHLIPGSSEVARFPSA